MANTIKLGNGTWATKEGSLLAYNDENNNFKPLPFTTTRDTIATVVNKQGLIETVGSGIPRIDFSDDANGALLLEPSATNLLTYSEDFSNASWTKSSSAVTITSNVAPDGTINSVYNLTGTNANLYTGGTPNIEHTISVYAKSNGQGKDNFKLRLGNSTSSSIIVTDKWVRYELTATPTTTVFGLTVDSSPNNEFDILIWGAQLESNSSYATSYIPTSGTAQTRVADTASGSGNSTVINSTEGVLYAEISALADDTSTRSITLSDSSLNNRFTIRYSGATNSIGFVTVVGTAVQGSGNFTTTDITDFNKVCLKYKLNDVALWINGVEVLTDTTSLVPSTNTLNLLSFDNGAGGSVFRAKVKDLRVYTTALSDAELTTLTTI